MDRAATVLGVKVNGLRFNESVERLLDAARTKSKVRAHFCTVATLVLASEDDRLRTVLNSAEMVAADGMPVVWLARRQRHDTERVCGPDVTLALADRGRAQGLRHYFYGAAPGVPERLAQELERRYPGIQIAGSHSPPFRPLTALEDDAIVRMINEARPDVVWVGLGSPKQEFWAADHQARLDAPVLLAVGAAFDFHSGAVKRAPRLMQRVGMEWLFRLASEPRRLWRRYTVTNLKFGWFVAADFVHSRARAKPRST